MSIELAVLTSLLLVLLAGVLLHTPGEAQVTTTTPFVPRFEVVAETRLLMEGLASSNYQSLQKLLKNPPADKAQQLQLQTLQREAEALLKEAPPDSKK